MKAMKSWSAAVAFLAVGVGVLGTAAAVNLRSSESLRATTQQLIGQCLGTSSLTPIVDSAGRAEQALLAGTQYVAPMIRELGFANTCQHATPQEAESRVVALEAVAVTVNTTAGCAAIASSGTLSVNDLNGIPELQCSGCNGSSYGLADWRDALRILYAGMPVGVTSLAARDCQSDLRISLAAQWQSIYAGGCSGGGCTELRHAFRPADGSGTAEIFLALLGLPETNPLGPVSPFCNARQPSDGWPAPSNVPSAPPYYPEFQDLDPLRRPCAGTNNSPATPFGAPPADAPAEQVCSASSTLGLVLPIAVPPVDAGLSPDPYAQNPCARGAYQLLPAAVKPTGLAVRCANGDTPLGTDPGVCLVPVDVSGNANCLNGKNNAPTVIYDPAAEAMGAAAVDGRVYNLHLRKANGDYQRVRRQSASNPAATTNAQIVGAFHRIHTTRSLLAPPSAAGNVCRAADTANQTACLTRASTCSLGIGDYPMASAPGVSALSVNGVAPTLPNIRAHVATPHAAGTYPLGARMFLNSMVGFDSVASFSAAQDALADCFVQPALDSVAAVNGLIPLQQAPVCVDFDERVCGSSQLNHDACKHGINSCPTLNAWGASPLQTSAGGTLNVNASGSDGNDPLITYLWTADAGTFANPNVATTTYNCTVGGPHTLRITLWDGQCSDFADIAVTCGF